MPSKKLHRTSVYRQLDTAARRSLGASPNANVTSIAQDPTNSQRAYITFDQPMAFVSSRGAPPDWTIADIPIGAIISLSTDGKTAHASFAAPFNINDVYVITATDNGGQLNSIVGGGINASSGTVGETPSPDEFHVTGIAHHGLDLTNKIITFDAPVATMPNPDFTGWAVGSATIDSILSNPDDTSVEVQLTTSAIIGSAWIVPAGTNTPGSPGTAFISIQAARLAAGTGIST